jgi:ABC-type glycerol-3-phosphate transport system substrate-binding protein
MEDDRRRTEPRKITRRRFLTAAGTGAALATGGQLGFHILGGRVARAAPAKTLRIGIYGYMPQGIPFDQVVKNYQQKHTDVALTVEPLPGAVVADWPATVRKFTLEARQRQASVDLLIGPTPWIEPAPLAQAQAIEPLDPLLPKQITNDLYRSVLREATFSGDGRMYVLPWWTDVTGLIYRRSYLQEGAGTDRPPETWDQVLAYAEKIRAKYGTRVYGYGADWWASHRLFLPILVTLTRELYDKDGVWKMDSDAFMEALGVIQKLHAFMPAASQQDLGSSRVFQAGGLAMQSYWQTQMLRAIQAGQPSNDIFMAPNPRGRHSGTIFWTAGAIIPKHSANKDEAVRFMVEGMLDPFTVQKTFDNYKIVPYHSIIAKMGDKVPAWAPPLLGTLSSAQPIPMNPHWLSVEQPIFKEEIEKMLLQSQPLQATRTNIANRIREKLREAGKR